MPNDRYLDATPALIGGYCVVLVAGRRVLGQALFDTAHDVAAAAALAALAVLTSDDALTEACRALGVATALPPPSGRKRCNCEEVASEADNCRPDLLLWHLSPLASVGRLHDARHARHGQLRAHALGRPV